MENLTGLIVRSKAGRDKGDYFIVLRSEEEFVYMANGELRKVDCPKKKKLKHLQMTSHICESVQENIRKGETVTNSELRKALAEYLN